MKSLRNKLIAAVTMLAVAAVMLTSASFAWYTVSTQGDVEKIKVDLQATTNLEIAKAKTGAANEMKDVEAEIGDTTLGQYAWGSVVNDWEDATPLDYVATLDPEEKVISTATIGTDGRLGALQAANAPTALANGIGYYTAKFDAEKPATGEAPTRKVAVVYGVWLRTNTEDEAGKGLAVTATKKFASDDPKNAYVSVSLITPEGAVPFTGDEATFTLTKDTPTLVKIVAYYDGELVDKASLVDEGLSVPELGIKFESTKGTVKGIEEPVAAAEP